MSVETYGPFEGIVFPPLSVYQTLVYVPVICPALTGLELDGRVAAAQLAHTCRRRVARAGVPHQLPASVLGDIECRAVHHPVADERAGFQKSVTGAGQWFYAARSYSLIR